MDTRSERQTETHTEGQTDVEVEKVIQMATHCWLIDRFAIEQRKMISERRGSIMSYKGNKGGTQKRNRFQSDSPKYIPESYF